MWSITVIFTTLLFLQSSCAAKPTSSQLLQRIADLERENARLKAGLQGISQLATSLLDDSLHSTQYTSENKAVVDAYGNSSGECVEKSPHEPPEAVPSAYYATVNNDGHGIVLPRGPVWFPTRYQVEPTQFVDGIGPQRLYVMPDFLSKSDCDFLIRYATAKFKPSEIMRDATVEGDELRVMTTRDSNSAYIEHSEVNAVPRLRAILERMHSVAGMSFELGETFQVTEYPPGAKYEFHYDSSVGLGRLATVLIYLNDVDDGGETVFPFARLQRNSSLPEPIRGYTTDQVPMAPFCASDSVLKFKPKAGSALFWFNHHPDLSVDSSTLHGSCPVKGNKKYIAQRWIRWYPHDEGNEFYETLRSCGIL